MRAGYIKDDPNEYGTMTAHFICVVCKEPYTVTPAPDPQRRKEWIECMSEFCDSYDPERDVDILFMSESEIMNSANKVVSIKKLGERKRFIQTGDLCIVPNFNPQPEER